MLFAGELPSEVQFGGIVLVSIGIAALALERGRLHFDSAPLAFATGISIASYTVVDGIGTRLSGSTFAYNAWMYVLWAPAMALGFVKLRGLRATIKPPREMITAVIGGIVAGGGYTAVVWAMNYADMGSVSALRETSVVFAAIIGALFLRESLSRLRGAACVVIAVGAALLA